MRTKTVIFIVISFLFVIAGRDVGMANPEKKRDRGPKRYKVKSGIIEYAISGIQTGTEKLYFDDWGRIEAKYTKTEFSLMGLSQKIDQMTLLKDGVMYSIDLDSRNGTKMETPLAEGFDASAVLGGQDMSAMGIDMIKRMGGKKVGKEKVKGYICEVFEIKQMNARVWVFHGLTLKATGGFHKMTLNSTATKVRFNVPVPGKKLKIPSDVTISKSPFGNINLEEFK